LEILKSIQFIIDCLVSSPNDEEPFLMTHLSDGKLQR